MDKGHGSRGGGGGGGRGNKGRRRSRGVVWVHSPRTRDLRLSSNLDKTKSSMKERRVEIIMGGRRRACCINIVRLKREFFRRRRPFLPPSKQQSKQKQLFVVVLRQGKQNQPRAGQSATHKSARLLSVPARFLKATLPRLRRARFFSLSLSLSPSFRLSLWQKKTAPTEPAAAAPRDHRLLIPPRQGAGKR